MTNDFDQNRKLSRQQRRLVAMLRLVGVVDATALVAVLLPTSTMAAVHQAIGLGEFPDDRIVSYLARSTSLLYAMFGVLMFYLSFHVAQFRPVIQFSSSLFALCGIVFLGIDIAEGMPLWWTLSEGPLVICVGCFLVWLCRQCEASDSVDASSY
ncbi:MAG: hypothetical protein O2820_04985 [Planctomycetota bacterium]|nr:hypothetical protein [Planctomycetota bacterium]MDA1248558.1 hypothetical protein [Planctomycetota bacterium]